MLPFFWGYVGVARGASEGMELPPIFATDSLTELVAQITKKAPAAFAGPFATRSFACYVSIC